jgi:hypothetical protein
MALGLPLDLLVIPVGRLREIGLELLELRFQVRLILSQCLLEHLALLGVHALGLGREAIGLRSYQLEGDLLELGDHGDWVDSALTPPRPPRHTQFI